MSGPATHSAVQRRPTLFPRSISAAISPLSAPSAADATFSCRGSVASSRRSRRPPSSCLPCSVPRRGARRCGSGYKYCPPPSPVPGLRASGTWLWVVIVVPRDHRGKKSISERTCHYSTGERERERPRQAIIDLFSFSRHCFPHHQDPTIGCHHVQLRVRIWVSRDV